MKKTISALILALYVVFSLLLTVEAETASDFEITEGVLTKYNGNSASVTVPDGVVKIGDNAFAGKTTLISVTLPDGLYSIGNRAFYNCTSLKEISNTKDITEIGAFAFTNTAYLNFAEDDLVSVNNILIYCAGGLAEVTIPQGINAIAPYTFAQNISLRSVTLPQSVISIGEGAFYGCSSLEEIYVPKSVSSIGALSFFGTAWLDSGTEDFVILGDGILVYYRGGEQADLPYGIKQIGGGAFYGNSKVKEVIVHSGCMVIQARAFADCMNLQRVQLPISIAGIDSTAFENSPNLKISADPDSFAARFAKAHSIKLDNIIPQAELGDVNSDGLINAYDSTLVLQRYSGIIGANTAGYDDSLADVDGSKSIDVMDATLILQLYSGIITGF